MSDRTYSDEPPRRWHLIRFQSVRALLPDGRPMQLCRWISWAPNYPKAGRLRFPEWPDLEWEILQIYPYNAVSAPTQRVNGRQRVLAPITAFEVPAGAAAAEPYAQSA